MGYRNAKSVPSLVFGLLSGVVQAVISKSGYSDATSSMWFPNEAKESIVPSICLAVWSLIMFIMFFKKTKNDGPPPDKMVNLLGEAGAATAWASEQKVFRQLSFLTMLTVVSAVIEAIAIGV